MSARLPRLTLLLVVFALLATACGPRFDRADVPQGPVIAGDGVGVDAGSTGGGSTTGTTTGTAGGGSADTTPGQQTTSSTGDGDASTATTAGDTSTSGATDGSTSGGDPTDGSATAGSATAGGDTGGDTSGTTSGSATSGGTTGPQAVEPGPQPGISDEPCEGRSEGGCIKVGVLVPLSGAAPVPPTWRNGIELYWDEVAEDGGIFGRNVELIIYDTESNTSTAVNRAVQLVNQDKVFTIFTLDRLEVHDAVGKRLEAIGMPNIHMQLPAPVPGGWQHSFGISMDHVSQGRAIASFFEQDLQATKVGFVREQTNALKPGTDAFTSKARELGMEVVLEATIDPNAGDYSATAQQICASGAEAVWLYMAPIPAGTIQGQTATCNPTWFANSVSWNFDIAVKQNTDPSFAFSPWAAVSSDRSREFKQAWAREYGSEPQDDVGFVGWSVDTVLHDMFLGAGEGLGWNSFETSIRGLERGGSKEWVPLDFTGGGINGTNAVFVFELDNTARQWKQRGDFRRY